MPPTVVVTPVSLEHGPRVSLGDHSKDVLAAMLLAGVYEDWHFAPPPLGMWPSMQVAFNVSRLAVGFGRKQHHAAAAAGCPNGWPSVGLNWSKHDGYDDYALLRADVDARVAPALQGASRRGATGLCVRTENKWRVHMHQVWRWERQGLVRPGVYSAVGGAIRRALLSDGGGGSSGGRGSGGSGSGTVVALHARRGDRAADNALNAVGTSRVPSAALVRATVQYVGAAAQRALGASRLRAVVVTEPDNSADLRSQGRLGGCPRAAALPAGAACEVRSESVLADLLSLVRSDVLCLDSSSFATLAYHCRGEAQLAVAAVRHVKQFFKVGAAGGGGGSGREGGSGGGALGDDAPPNLLYLYPQLQRAAEAEAAVDGVMVDYERVVEGMRRSLEGARSRSAPTGAAQ